MDQQKPRHFIVPEHSYGVCVWEVDGAYLSDGDGFLSLEGVIGDHRIEEKMREAAHYWLGVKEGRPKWLPGARKITQDEFDDQNARLLDGKIPDPVEAMRLASKGKS
jgi:hypothetical protein